MLPRSQGRSGLNPTTRTRLKETALLVVCVFLFPSCWQERSPQAALESARASLARGDLKGAAKEADWGYHKFHNVTPEWAWKFTIVRATALYREDMYDLTLSVLASEPTVPPAGELSVRKRWLEGLAYTSLGRFEEADRSFRSAEGLCAVSDSSACADLLSAQGALEMQRGRYAQAQEFFERVFNLVRKTSNKIREAGALLDLSWSANEQAHFDEALDWASAARQISLDRNSPDIAQASLGNMAWAYYKLGDTEKALAMFSEAATQAESVGDATDEIKWITNAGYVHLDASDFSVAGQSFKKSLYLARELKSREEIADSLDALAFVSEQTGKLDDAKRYADEALTKAREDKNGRDQVYPQLVLGRLAARAHDAATAENTFREVAQSPDCPVFLKWEAERSLARLYEDENHLDFAESEYRTALNTFETARSELKHEDSRLPFLSNASHIYDDYIHFLVSQGKAAEALQVADFSRGRTLAEGLGLLQKGTSFNPDRRDPREIARQASGAVLFYWLGEKQSYLWAITAKKVSLFTLPAAAEIEASIERYQKALQGPQDVLVNGDAGTSLYRMLIAPARDLLPANARVVIIPDGKLNNLNFETLVVPDPEPHYWIEDATVVNASSLRLLSASRSSKNKGRGRSLLLLGNAVSASPEYPELPNAAVEMKSVEEHFPEAQEIIFQRDQATPAAYLASDPERFSYIHFVAHGMASRLSPLDSAIVLSKNGGQNENFKLYARDIIEHPVRAELVTISACYGAGTRAYSGEGLVGLSWAFLHSGAHNVVAALWEANDVSTGQLMDKFYGELNRGKTPDKALREAKLALLHSDTAFRKPLYWGPFQLYSGL